MCNLARYRESPLFKPSLLLVAAVACGKADRARDTAAVAPVAAESGRAAETRQTLPDSGEAVLVLDGLKRIAPPLAAAFNIDDAPQFSPDSILALVSDSGLTLKDVNEERDSVVQLSKAVIREQLLNRKGRAFESLVHLAYIAAQPAPQYSELAFSRASPSLIVNVGEWYILGFVSEGGHTRVRSVDYEEHEGE